MNVTQPQPTTPLAPVPPIRPVKRGVNVVGVVVCALLLFSAVGPWLLEGNQVQLDAYGPHVVIGFGALLLVAGLLGAIAQRRRAGATAESTTPHRS